MTTIAYRDGVMVGDGRETYCEEGESFMIFGDQCVKVYRLPDGRLFGAAKTSEDILTLHDALMAGCAQDPIDKWPTPKLDDINGMCVDLDGTIYAYEGTRWTKVEESYHAVGSGARYALPALDAGADANTACRIGMKRDPFSGGRVTELRLEVPPQPAPETGSTAPSSP